MSAPAPSRLDRSPAGLRHWAGEAWYYGRLVVLSLAALLVVCFMVSAIVLANWPRLAGPYQPLVKRDNPVQQADRREMRERWGRDEGSGGNPAGRTPMDAYRNGATGPPTADAEP